MKSFWVLTAAVGLGVLYFLWLMFGRYVKRNRIRALVEHEEIPMHTNRFVGEIGRTISVVTNESGQVEVNGELWEARAVGATGHFREGSRVRVRGYHGTYLVVEGVD